MSISPPSDIVLGVASAIDPEKYRVAAERLALLGGDATTIGTSATAATKVASAGEQFYVPQVPVSRDQTSIAAQVPVSRDQTSIAAQVPAQQPAATSQSASASPATASTAAPDREVKAYKQLEAYLMQTFIETMLPKDAANVYGSGTAGDVWRSMLAEHMANEMAGSSALGIADRITKSKARMHKPAASAVSGAADAQASAVNTGILSDLQTLIASDAQSAAATPVLGNFLDRRRS